MEDVDLYGTLSLSFIIYLILKTGSHVAKLNRWPGTTLNS